jgi:hypothetical protein
MEPQGELGQVAGLGHLAVEEVLVELLAAEGELVTSSLEGLVHPDHVGQEVPLLAEVLTEHPIGQTAEQSDDLPPQTTAGHGWVEMVGKGPVVVKELEGAAIAGLLVVLGAPDRVGLEGLPEQGPVLCLQSLEYLFRVKCGLSHVLALLLSAAARCPNCPGPGIS